MSPPRELSSTSKRSVFTVMGSPVATGAALGGAGAATFAPVAPGVLGALGAAAEPASVGNAGTVLVVVTTLGALCFCQASHRKSAETEKTISAMRRCVSIMGGGFSGHRVEAAVVPRVAFGDAPHREPRSAQRAVFLDRPHGVFGARGIEAALIPPPRAQQVSVATNGQDQQALHSAGGIPGELVEVRANLGEYGRHVCIVEALTQHHHAIEARELEHMAAEGLAHKALHAIPVDGASRELSGEGNAEPRHPA